MFLPCSGNFEKLQFNTKIVFKQTVYQRDCVLHLWLYNYELSFLQKGNASK